MKTILKVQPQMTNHIPKYVYFAMFALGALLYALPAEAYTVKFCVQNGSPWHVCLTYGGKTGVCYAYAPANSIGSWGPSCITYTGVVDGDVAGPTQVNMYNVDTGNQYVGYFKVGISLGHSKGWVDGPYINTKQKNLISGGVGTVYNASGGKDHVITLDRSP